MMNNGSSQASIDGLSIRRYRPEDRDAVLHLYHNGLLRGWLDIEDTAADLDSIEEAYFSQPGDYFWVADVRGRIVGTIGVMHDGPHVSQIRRLRADDEYRETGLVARLIETAVHHCWQHGFLKVIFDTHVDPNRTASLVEKLSLQYDRSKNVHGKDVLEFYVDLYHHPGYEADRDEADSAPEKPSDS